jgi:hypothetical protein
LSRWLRNSSAKSNTSISFSFKVGLSLLLLRRECSI